MVEQCTAGLGCRKSKVQQSSVACGAKYGRIRLRIKQNIAVEKSTVGLSSRYRLG